MKVSTYILNVRGRSKRGMTNLLWAQDDWFSWEVYIGIEGLEEKIRIHLEPDDLCVILTLDGAFGGIWAFHHQDCLDEGDAIQEWMSHTMAQEDSQQGAWLWHVKKDLKGITGDRLGDIEEDEE